MKKSIIILTAIALIAGGCGEATKQQEETAEYTLPSVSDYRVNSDKISKKNIFEVNETRFVILIPPNIEKEDETFVDDWAHYTSQANSYFYNELGVEYDGTEKDYVSFALKNGEKFIVDAKKIREDHFLALLYVKGHIPIFVDIVFGDKPDDMENIQNYLKDVKKNKAKVDESKSDETAEHEGELVPAGYRLYEKLYGDLNGDTRNDYVMIVENEKTNRRGMLIFLDVGHSDEPAFKNLSCFAPENDGTYLSMDIRDGNLIIHYDDLEQRDVEWQYTIRYRNNNFELIGFDEHNTSPFYESSNINFLTKKMLIRNQQNANNDIVQEVCYDIDIKTSLKINELFKHLAGFDDLNAKIFSAQGWRGIIDIIN